MKPDSRANEIYEHDMILERDFVSSSLPHVELIVALAISVVLPDRGVRMFSS